MQKNQCQSILVAEDNEDVRETIASVLSNEGYVVKTARDGREALQALREMPAPTLVLLDLMMPVMSGWEFLDAQKADAVLRAHQVVTISAVRATESLEDSTPLKTAGTLSKPLELESMLAEVRKFCGQPPLSATA